jgi:hypothetical protein
MQRSRRVFVSLTRVRTGDQPPQNATIVGEEMDRWLRDIDGFHGLLILSRPGSTLGLAFWETREIAEQHQAKRMEFLHRMLAVADVEIDEILDYDVTFANLGPVRE